MRLQDLAAISRPESGVGGAEAIAASSRLSLADAELLVGLRAGASEAFEELVVRFQGTIYNLAYRMVNDAEEARDITQETFLKIFQAAGSFRGEAEFKTWIYRITVNQIANHQRWWRRRWRRDTVSLDTVETEDGQPLVEKLVSPLDDPEQRTLMLERGRHLATALAAVKFDFRVAVILRDVKDLTYEEIADMLQISVGTVKSRIARGREELRRKLRNGY